MSSNYKDVRAFHEKFGVPIADKPGFPDQETMDLRVKLIAEELCEFLTACGYVFQVSVGHHAADNWNVFSNIEIPDEATPLRFSKAVDGLLDLEYVIQGRHCAFGVDPVEPWRRVHAANMTKEGGAKRADGKILKPEGFVPPDIEGALRDQGWEG